MNDIFEINFKYNFRNDFSSATRDFKSVHYDSETTYILPTIPDKLVGTKLKNPVKLDTGKKSLISTFACFLTAIAKDYFREGRLGTALCLHPI